MVLLRNRISGYQNPAPSLLYQGWVQMTSGEEVRDEQMMFVESPAGADPSWPPAFSLNHRTLGGVSPVPPEPPEAFWESLFPPTGGGTL